LCTIESRQSQSSSSARQSFIRPFTQASRIVKADDGFRLRAAEAGLTRLTLIVLNG
jgi:hypothetical protein